MIELAKAARVHFDQIRPLSSIWSKRYKSMVYLHATKLLDAN